VRRGAAAGGGAAGEVAVAAGPALVGDALERR
jgi:hypothetical protein